MRKRQHCLHKTRVIAIQEVHLPIAFMLSRGTVIKQRFVQKKVLVILLGVLKRLRQGTRDCRLARDWRVLVSEGGQFAASELTDILY